MKLQGTLAVTNFPRHVEIRGTLGSRPLRLYLQHDGRVHLVSKNQDDLALLIADGVDHPIRHPDTGTSSTMIIGRCKGDAAVFIDGHHVVTETALDHLTDAASHASESLGDCPDRLR